MHAFPKREQKIQYGKEKASRVERKDEREEEKIIKGVVGREREKV